MDDCYYNGYPERYSPDDVVECVSNVYDAEGLKSEGVINFDQFSRLGDPEPPITFAVCDVDWANGSLRSHGTCCECKLTMIDDGIMLQRDGKMNNYCRMCLDWERIYSVCAHYSPTASRDINADKWADVTYEQLRDASHRTKRKGDLCTSILATLRAALTLRHEEEIARRAARRKRKHADNEAVAAALAALVPGARLETCKRLRKVFKLDVAPRTTDALLTDLIEGFVEAKEGEQ